MKTIFLCFKNFQGRRFNTLLEQTPFYLLLWEIFSFYNPDPKSDGISVLSAPDLPLETMRTTNKRNGKWVKKCDTKINSVTESPTKILYVDTATYIIRRNVVKRYV